MLVTCDAHSFRASRRSWAAYVVSVVRSSSSWRTIARSSARARARSHAMTARPKLQAWSVAYTARSQATVAASYVM